VNAVLRGYLREHDETKKLLAGLKNFAARARLVASRMAGCPLAKALGH